MRDLATLFKLGVVCGMSEGFGIYHMNLSIAIVAFLPIEAVRELEA
jgi:hypothetical protein